MNLRIPSTSLFGNLFESAGEYFFYDASSQEILAVEPALAGVLANYDQCAQGAFPAILTDEFSLGELEKARQTIPKAYQAEGLFLGPWPRLESATRRNSRSRIYDIGLQHLVLTLTESCNLRCRYCLHGASLDWVRPHGKGVMPQETALEATRYFLARCRDDGEPATISFYGGEALLRLEVIEAVSREVRAHPRGKEAHLVVDTNGVLLDEAARQMVLRHGLHLQISLDGPREYHDRQRPDTRGSGTYDRIMANLDLLLDRDPAQADRLSFSCTLAPPVDLLQLDHFFAHFPPYEKRGISGPPNLVVNRANLNGQSWPATRADFVDFNKQLDQIREIYLQAIEQDRRHELGPVIKGLVEPGLFRLHHRSRAPISEVYTPGGNCRPGIRKLHVTVDGRLQPCERTGDRLDLGRIGEGLDPAAVDVVQEGFHRTVSPRCSHCWALRLCGICFSSWAENGGQQGPDGLEPVCNSFRAGLQRDLELLVRILQLPESLRSYLDDVVLV